MEKLKKRLFFLAKALNALQQSIELYENNPQEPLHSVTRDSVIKRFEFSFDLLWKCVKEALEIRHVIFEKSPKAVFRACLKLDLMTPEQVEKLLYMVDARNTTAHEYDESAAEEIAQQTKVYCGLMQELAEKINN